jgi:hypothetical protein
MEISMSIKTRITAFTFAAILATGVIASTAANAFPPLIPPIPLPGPGPGPGPWGPGFGAGMLGAAIVGSAIAAGSHTYYDDDDYVSCRWVRRFDARGDYRGRARVCR